VGMATREADHIVVAAAVIERDDAFLMTRRPEGTHLEGLWEFPGGKQHPGESLAECLVREIREELACDVQVRALILETSHHYGARSVRLHFFDCRLGGEPLPQQGQAMRWVARDELRFLPVPEADRDLVDWLTRQ